MDDRTYEYVVVGSGTGGGVLAEALARRGKDVLVLERGIAEKNVGTFRDSLRYYDGNSIARTPHKAKEGTILWRTFMAGGSSVVACANGVRCLETELSQLGIDLEQEFQEMEAETKTSPIDDGLLSEGSHALQEAGRQLGYSFERMPKFISSESCARCGNCTLGCKQGAKWSALRPLAALAQFGAETDFGVTVDKVMRENGKAVGVEGRGPDGRIRVKADTVILAAGALGTPVILQRSGVEAGRGLFMDLFVNTYAATTGLNQVNEPQMTLVDLQFHKEGGFLLSPYVNQPRAVRFIELGVAGLALSSKKLIGIMAKITDDRAGEVFPDGSVSKPVTKADRGRLNEGAARAKEILAKAGGDPKSMGVSAVQGAHPGGTAAIGEVVDTNLETKVSGLFVCDASVLPAAPGLPPMLTIGALAKYLGKKLAG